MKKVLTTFAILLGLTPSAFAAWFEVSGQANIVESTAAARNHAIEDAVFQAIYYSGADLSTFQYLQPLLTQEKDNYLLSGHEVREIQVSAENKANGIYYITIRADIYPTAKTCHQVQYKKPVLISEFSLSVPQQASLGAIYQLGEDFSEVLNRQLNRQSQSFISPPVTRVAVDPGSPQTAIMLAKDHDAQFLISGQITDITATLNERAFAENQTYRQFATFVQVMDAQNGEVVFQKDYRDLAEWPFERTSQLDTRSARFWQSSYGQMVLRISRDIMLDMENQLACRTSLPEIVNTHHSLSQVNVGRIHGVNQGDQLQLWHRAAFVDQNGIPRNRMVRSNIQLVVDRVYESSAEVRALQPDLARSIQVGDVVTRIIPETDR
uniref:flagella assembly protein FlgT n=1 Tax=Thaumasiovibrio occultus TaxID=1891184 RepID=UPI000B34BD8A|nr:flagella assembly protein FlgT [Thaumasiovibrio occultus]